MQQPPSYDDVMRQNYGSTGAAVTYTPVPTSAYPPSTGGPQYQTTASAPPLQGEGTPAATEAPHVEEGEFAASGFNSTSIRHGFIRKVYLILTAQWCITLGIVAAFQFIQPVKYWVQRNSWFYYVSYATFLIVYILLLVLQKFRRMFPWNLIGLLVFTLALSYMAATIACFYDTPAVLTALGITAALCLGLTLFSIQTKIDFTLCSGLIFAFCWTMVLFGLAVLIVWQVNGTVKLLHVVYSSLGVVVFSMFLVFDTQLIVGGRKHELNPEEYVMGALQLYLDMVLIFLYVLSIVGVVKS